MKSKLKSAAKTPAKAESAKKRAAKAEKPAVKQVASGAAAKKAKAPAKSAVKSELKAKKPVKASKAATAREKVRTTAPKKAAEGQVKTPAKKRATGADAAVPYRIGEPVLDPIGDTSDGEGRTYLGELERNPAAAAAAGPNSGMSPHAEPDAFRKETHIEASDSILEAGPGMEAVQAAKETSARSAAVETAEMAGTADAATQSEPRGPERLERLQKILSQAGIASRRRAEEMITEGRVIVNGQVVTTLGSKADPARDHIRVDGKLLHGAERHRYFLLNKPKGYVTTVSDPEGRPTVMKFFERMQERLYPVGRLDYQSEGLLLMTNDGELANLLTKAGSGVEKTYLVKVAGQPAEEELEKLRRGVTIERGEAAGSGRVRTAPAKVKQVRVGDNPWFEVVLIEGRNRELRKMFAAVGHFVEKIRRVGYGPLTLDVEPGKMRELTQQDVNLLRLTAEGKIKPRHVNADRMLPKDAGVPAEKRFEKRGKRGGKAFGRRESGGFEKRGSGDFRRREGGGFAGRERKEFGRREGGSFAKPGRGDFGKRDGGDLRRGGFGGPREHRPFGGPKPESDRPQFDRPKFDRPRFAGGPRRDREGSGFDGERKPFGKSRDHQPAGFAGGRKSFGNRGKREFGPVGGKTFRPPSDRPDFRRGAPEGPLGKAPGQGFERGQRKEWGARSKGRGGDRPQGEFRGPRQPSPEFRGQGKKFGGGKPRFGGKPSGFGGPRREGGRDGRPGAGRPGVGRPGGGRGFGGKKRG